LQHELLSVAIFWLNMVPIPRDRGSKSSDEVHDVLAKFATSPWFLKYPENEKAGIQKSTVTNHAAMVKELKVIQPNLSFTKQVLQRSLRNIASSDTAATWPLTDTEREDWAVKMEKRVKVLCRHVSQGLLKAKHSKSKTNWLLKLFDDGTEATTTANPDEHEATKPDDSEGGEDEGDDKGEETGAECEDEFSEDKGDDKADKDVGIKDCKKIDKSDKAGDETYKQIGRGGGRGRGRRGRGRASGSAPQVHTK
jgi:hypothetical protein